VMETTHKRPTQKQKLLKILQMRGRHGAYNWELNEHVSFRYSARIHELRHEGHNITTQKIKDGVFKHVLIPESLTNDSD
jgi:hypothetical protein